MIVEFISKNYIVWFTRSQVLGSGFRVPGSGSQESGVRSQNKEIAFEYVKLKSRRSEATTTLF